MLYRRPLGLMGFSNLAFVKADMTLDLKGEMYQLPIPTSAPTFDFTELTVIACPEGAPADVIVMPINGNIAFKTMATFAHKKVLRIFAPDLTPANFKLTYGS